MLQVKKWRPRNIFLNQAEISLFSVESLMRNSLINIFLRENS